MLDNLTAAPVDIKWHPGLPIYASERFLRVVGDEYGWLGGVDNSGRLRCILPFTVIRKAGFRFVRFRVETLPLEGELDMGEEQAFLKSVVAYFRSNQSDVIVPSGNTAIFRTYPDGAESAPYGTFINDLSQSEDALMGEIRPTYRHNIRKAINAGVKISCSLEYIDTAYQLIAETLKRSGVDFHALSEFRNRILCFGDHVKIFVAEHGGVVQACMVAPFSQYAAYNCYAGSRPEPVLGAMHLLHWEAIRHFRALGIRRFDFQGVRINPEMQSKQEGIMHYKKGFGGKLVQGYVWKCSLRPVRSAAYSLAVRLFKGGDIVDQEHSRLIAQRR